MNRREALEFVKKQASAHATYLRGMSAYVDDEVEQDSIEVANDIDEAISILSQEPEDVYEECARIAELDSLLNWIGGSTGHASGTARNIAAAIRKRKQEVEGK